MRILAVAHQDGAEPGVLADVAASKGVQLDQWNIYADRGAPAPTEEYAGVVLLGGNMHADDDHAHPWLSTERALVRECLADGRPLLGICLGAQLLAQVTEGLVRRAAAPEIGWHEITLNGDARTDPLFASVPRRTLAFQWHIDEFQTAAGHVKLARSNTCEQAFRVGDAAWGVQFHPEVTKRTVSDWIARQLSRGDSPVSREALAGVKEDTAACIREWNRVGTQLFDGFVTRVLCADGLNAAPGR